jgi:hypothetical protein
VVIGVETYRLSKKYLSKAQIFNLLHRAKLHASPLLCWQYGMKLEIFLEKGGTVSSLN